MTDLGHCPTEDEMEYEVALSEARKEAADWKEIARMDGDLFREQDAELSNQTDEIEKLEARIEDLEANLRHADRTIATLRGTLGRIAQSWRGFTAADLGQMAEKSLAETEAPNA